MNLIPIFVVDRPVSLRILSELSDFNGQYGILSHAFTTDRFKTDFSNYSGAKIKVGDSGIYQGKDIPYKELFDRYLKMGVTHGIIKDYYRNPLKTLKSAKRAIKYYKRHELVREFILVGVAQGNSVDDYLQRSETSWV